MGSPRKDDLAGLSTPPARLDFTRDGAALFPAVLTRETCTVIANRLDGELAARPGRRLSGHAWLNDLMGPDGALGRIAAAEATTVAQAHPVLACHAIAGDVWAYATPVLHASEMSRSMGRRRVLQTDYAVADLPGGLRWRGIN